MFNKRPKLDPILFPKEWVSWLAPTSTPVVAEVVAPKTEIKAMESKGVGNLRASDIDANCVFPIDLHPNGKTKRLQTSTLVKCGTTVAKVCMLEHYKETEHTNSHLLPLFTPTQLDPSVPDVVGLCDSPHCPLRGAKASLPFSTYSLKQPDRPLFLFCSFTCCIDRMSQCSPSKVSKSLTKEKH